MTQHRVGGSFRDPAGFVYRADGLIHRRVNAGGASDYDRLMTSGLYQELVSRGWLVSHEEVAAGDGSHRTLLPQQIPYVSYPYEWSFGQLKDAALLTLGIQQLSLAFGMSLKDASAYNVQFIGYRPVFIDTLSFEVYHDGVPWAAYRQFCQHFLAPLALMARVDPRLRRLLTGHIDGIPLDLASAMLPARSWLSAGTLLHVHLHARGQRQHRDDGRQRTPVRVPTLPKARLVALIDSLTRAVAGGAMPPVRTEWGHYYDDTNYSSAAMAAKASLVTELIEASGTSAGIIHDLGANTGRFSQLVASPGRYVVAHDIDELAVERHYQDAKAQRLERVLPLVLDLTQPSPALGWALEERESAVDRLAGGTVLALALVHHLAISNNVPLPELARFFARIARTLVIEFVPKDDSQVQRLLATRADIFPDYTAAHFEAAMAAHFEIQRTHTVPETVRTMYLMRRR